MLWRTSSPASCPCLMCSTLAGAQIGMQLFSQHLADILGDASAVLQWCLHIFIHAPSGIAVIKVADRWIREHLPGSSLLLCYLQGHQASCIMSVCRMDIMKRECFAARSWGHCGSLKGSTEMLSRRWLPHRLKGCSLQSQAALQLPGRLSLMMIWT